MREFNKLTILNAQTWQPFPSSHIRFSIMCNADRHDTSSQYHTILGSQQQSPTANRFPNEVHTHGAFGPPCRFNVGAAGPACPGRAVGSRRLPATPRVADGPAGRRGFIKRSNHGTFACARSPPVSLDAPSLKRSSSLLHPPSAAHRRRLAGCARARGPVDRF